MRDIDALYLFVEAISKEFEIDMESSDQEVSAFLRAMERKFLTCPICNSTVCSICKDCPGCDPGSDYGVCKCIFKPANGR